MEPKYALMGNGIAASSFFVWLILHVFIRRTENEDPRMDMLELLFAAIAVENLMHLLFPIFIPDEYSVFRFVFILIARLVLVGICWWVLSETTKNKRTMAE